MSELAIVDYARGNLRSVLNAVREVGGQPRLVRDPAELASAERIIVPGVGAFSAGMQHLERTGMIPALQAAKDAGTPLLGICLGMQLFCAGSEEGGDHAGLGWIDARVRRFPDQPGLKVPHMGWNDVHKRAESPLTEDLPDACDVYFVHSYYVECADPEDVILSGDYGVPYCAAFARENVVGVQFHPEKSQQAGLRFLKRFLELPPC